MLSRPVHTRLSSLILIVGPVVTLAMAPLTNFDPINPIKVLVACSISFTCLALLLKNWSSSWFTDFKILIIGISLFVIGLFLSLLFSGAPWNQQIWGTFGRNNGLLNYLSLSAVLLCSAVLMNKNLYRKIVLYLIITSVPMIFYCLIQLLGLDPFPWSSFQAFGTLGNVNFLSAFLGMASIASLSLSLDSTKNNLTRVGAATLVLIGIFIVFETDSIQGILIFGVGSLILVGFTLKNRLRKLFLPYVIGALSLVGLAAIALFDKGPLAKFIFQPTIIFRAEYMTAGIKMFQENLLFGVGIDSYGDWYSRSRGIIATFRTGINRTSNSAHNVFIDVAAGSGIIALLGFLTINLGTFIYAIRYFKKNPNPDLAFVTLFAMWIAYTIQSSISINQMGIAIWGWIFAGSIIGFARARENQEDLELPRSKKKAKLKNTLSAGDSLAAFAGLVIGFTLTFLPLKTDSDYRKFSNAGDLSKMMEIVQMPTSSAVLVAQTQIAASKSSYFAQARELNEFLVTRYPRDFFGWQSRVVLDQMESQKVALARAKVRELDPYFFCFEANPATLIREALSTLSPSDQWELAKFWGISLDSRMPANFSLSTIDDLKYQERLDQYCKL